MKTFVFDPSSSGVSGDMLLAALFATGLDVEDYAKKFSKITNLSMARETRWTGEKEINRMQIKIEPDIHSPTFTDMRALLQKIDVTEAERVFSLKVLDTLKNAEKEAHGGVHPLEELGSLDTLVDVIGVAYAAEKLGMFDSKVVSLPVAIGEPQGPHQGQAVAEMLKHGIPYNKKNTKHELTTPTGLATLLNIATFVDEFAINGGITYYSIGTAELPEPHVLGLSVI